MDPQLSKTSKIIEIGPVAFENDPNEIGRIGKKKYFIFPGTIHVGGPTLRAGSGYSPGLGQNVKTGIMDISMTTYPFQLIFCSFVVLMSISNPENMSSNGPVVMNISMIPVFTLSLIHI